MKLYYSNGACSLSPHIALREAGLDFALERVDIRAKKILATDGDFRQVNPKGYVPALELDDGTVLTEGPAIVQYVADLRPDSRLAPANGTLARYRLQEWLNFISTEIHKQFSPLFSPQTSDEQKQLQRERIAARFSLVEPVLAKQPYLLGETFSVADAYLFTVVRWSPLVGVDLAPFPALAAFQARVAERPAVQAALEAERLGSKPKA